MAALVQLFTKPSCPFCVNAVRLLEQLKVPFDNHDVTHNPELRAKVSKSVGNFPTVPMIFVGDRFVGGFSDLQALHHQGRLMPLIAEAKAHSPATAS